jgi:hypothetical protein
MAFVCSSGLMARLPALTVETQSLRKCLFYDFIRYISIKSYSQGPGPRGRVPPSAFETGTAGSAYSLDGSCRF